MGFMLRKKDLLISFGVMLTCALGAVLPVLAREQTSCVQPQILSVVGQQRCARLAYEKSDRELNSVWKEVIFQLSGNEKERLIDRQLAWIEYRDATCDEETRINRGGNGYRIFLHNCLRKVTIERTKFLRGYLK